MANQVTFQGGPCSGRVASFTDAAIRDGLVSCGGINYVVLGQSPGVYLAIPSSEAIQPAPGVSTLAPTFAGGYHDLQRALAMRLWPALNRARANDLRALRVLSRRSRIKSRKP